MKNRAEMTAGKLRLVTELIKELNKMMEIETKLSIAFHLQIDV